MENTAAERRKIKSLDEIKGYKFDLHLVNRDGDEFFIECPDCHSADLRGMKLFRCRDCGTLFNVYLEDGHKILSWIRSKDKPSKGCKEMIVANKRGAGNFGNSLIWPVDLPDVAKLKDVKIAKYGRDLRKDGMDCHGHKKYKKFLLVPIE